MLGRLSRRLGSRRGLGAHLAALEWRLSYPASNELAGLRQAAGLAAPAASGSSSGGGGSPKGNRCGGGRGKGRPRGKPFAAPDGSEGVPHAQPSQPATPEQLGALVARFKVSWLGCLILPPLPCCCAR